MSKYACPEDGFDPIVSQMGFDAGLKAGIRAERERCALIAENYPIVAPSSEIVIQTTMEVAAMSIADTIRNPK